MFLNIIFDFVIILWSIFKTDVESESIMFKNIDNFSIILKNLSITNVNSECTISIFNREIIVLIEASIRTYFQFTTVRDGVCVLNLSFFYFSNTVMSIVNVFFGNDFGSFDVRVYTVICGINRIDRGIS